MERQKQKQFLERVSKTPLRGVFRFSVFFVEVTDYCRRDGVWELKRSGPCVEVPDNLFNSEFLTPTTDFRQAYYEISVGLRTIQIAS